MMQNYVMNPKIINTMSKVTITDKASNSQQEYIAKFNGVVGSKEHEVIVYGFSFPAVRGNGATS